MGTLDLLSGTHGNAHDSHALGGKGSGKSFALRRIWRLIFGSEFDVIGVTGDLRDLDAVLTNQHLVVIDNVDSPVPQLLDRLAGAATGQVITKRKLFTTNEPTTSRMRAFLGITAATPYFQRDDIVDRALPIRLLRRVTFESESKLWHEFDEKRDELRGLLVEQLGVIVDMLADNPPAAPSELRIADFGDFAERVALAFGVEKPREILARLQQAQEDPTIEGDGILEVVELWQQKRIGGSRPVEPGPSFPVVL